MGRTMMRLSAIVAVAAAIGCSGGSGSLAASGSSGSSTTSSSSSASSSSSTDRLADQLAADRATAAAVVLHASDFPVGWTESPPDDSTTSPEEAAATNEFAACLGVDPALVGNDTASDQKAKAKGDKFKRGDSLEVESDVTVESNAELAGVVLQVLRKPGAGDCFQQFFNKALAAALSDPSARSTVPSGVSVGTADLTTAQLGLHTDNITFRATIPVTYAGVLVHIGFDFVFAVRGRTDITLSFFNAGAPFPQDLEVQLANAAIDRAPPN